MFLVSYYLNIPTSRSGVMQVVFIGECKSNFPKKALSYFLDTFLKSYLKHVKSYIQDSVDFLNKYPREVDPDV